MGGGGAGGAGGGVVVAYYVSLINVVSLPSDGRNFASLLSDVFGPLWFLRYCLISQF